MRGQATTMMSIAAGVLLIAAEPAPPTPTSGAAEALRTVLPKPRLYRVSTKQDGTVSEPFLLCLGADTLAKEIDAARALPSSGVPAPAACRDKSGHTSDGSVHIDMTCDGTPRDAGGSRISLEVGAAFKAIHQHMELGTGAGNSSAALVFDIQAVEVGDCPAGMKSAEARSLDGSRLENWMGPTTALLAVAAQAMAAGRK